MCSINSFWRIYGVGNKKTEPSSRVRGKKKRHKNCEKREGTAKKKNLNKRQRLHFDLREREQKKEYIN